MSTGYYHVGLLEDGYVLINPEDKIISEPSADKGALERLADYLNNVPALPVVAQVQTPLKLWRAKTKTVVGLAVPADYTDWYHAQTQDEARELWLEDSHRYGVPLEKTTVELVECDEQTLKPIGK